MEENKDFHFYAANAIEWMTTREGRNLPQLITKMKKRKLKYILIYVPLPANAQYQIKDYFPVVEGTVFLGEYDR